MYNVGDDSTLPRVAKKRKFDEQEEEPVTPKQIKQEPAENGQWFIGGYLHGTQLFSEIGFVMTAYKVFLEMLFVPMMYY